MPAQFVSEWSDIPPTRYVIDSGADGIRIAFEHEPDVEWNVQEMLWIDGIPHVTRYSAGFAGQGFFPLDLASPPNLRHLAAICARTRNVAYGPRHRFDTLGQRPWYDTFRLVTDEPAKPTDLGKKPDKRTARKDPEGYAQAMREWTAPIAKAVRDAAAQLYPIQESVQREFSPNPKKPFSITYAEKLIALAREYHDLPKRGDRPDDSKSSSPTPGTNTKKDK